LAITGGPTPSTALTVNLPSGYTIDTNKISPSVGDSTPQVGFGNIRDNATNTYPVMVQYNNTTSVGVVHEDDAASGIVAVSTTPSSPVTFVNTDGIQLEFTVPITGWSSNAVISSDFGGRVIASKYRTNSANTVATTTTTIIDFEDVIFDKTASVTTGASWKFTAPETGIYFVNVTMGVVAGPTWVASNELVIYLYKNGAFASAIGGYGAEAAVSTNFVYAAGSDAIELSAGDYIDIRIWQNSGDSVSLYTGSSGAYNNVSIHKIQSPQTLMGSEKVVAVYNSSGADTMAVATASTWYMDFENKEIDTHNAVSGTGSNPVTTTNTGWKFTAPIAGMYEITAKVGLSNATSFPAGDFVAITIKVNNVDKAIHTRDFQATTTDYHGTPLITKIQSLAAGDRVEIVFSHNTGTNKTTVSDGSQTYVCIKSL
jgi:hypothetical protein